jgi:DNA-binding MarR family transcriptional regulator
MTTDPPGPGQLDPLTVELPRAVLRFRRSLRRTARQDFNREALSPTEVELVSLIRSRPGTGVAAAAAELRLAPNTVSTIIRKVVVIGLVHRDFDPADRRAARLTLTRSAEERLAEWRSHRADVLSTAMAGLEAGERDVLARAIPLLEKLSESLDRARREPPALGLQGGWA